jgi:hypothetical protein
MDANQAKTDASHERLNASWSEEIKSGQVEMTATVNAFQKMMDALIVDIKDGRRERTACQEATGNNPEKIEQNP